jgi:cell division protein FtsA
MSPLTKQNRTVICGLDIGTTKVAFLMAAVGEKGVEIIGAGFAPNTGVRHGVVVNIDQTADAIRKAREEAELMSGVQAQKAWVSVGGLHIESFASSGMVAIRGDDVHLDDVHRVIEVAKAVAIPSERQVLHVLPKDFKIDGQEGITDPIGMSGVRLECQVHIVTANRSIVQNLLKSVEKAGVHVSGLALQQIASAGAVLSDDEKKLGVALIDIGGGTSDIVVFQRGAVVHTATVPVGGLNFTHDVATGLRTTQVSADLLKVNQGCALPDMISADETVQVDSVGDRPARTVPRLSLCRIIEARAEETLKLIHRELESKSLLPQLGSGVIFTGAASELKGLVEMGSFIFDMPVRLGFPRKVGGLTDVVKSPKFSTALGLILYAVEKESEKITTTDSESPRGNVFAHWGQSIKDFFSRTLQ